MKLTLTKADAELMLSGLRTAIDYEKTFLDAHGYYDDTDTRRQLHKAVIRRTLSHIKKLEALRRKIRDQAS